MSPQEAKIFMAEDDKYYAETLGEFLTMAGHAIVAHVRTLAEALHMIDELPEDSIQVGLIDANLDEWEDRGFDGIEIAKSFRKRFPKASILGISLNPQPWSDVPESCKRIGGNMIAKFVTGAKYPRE